MDQYPHLAHARQIISQYDTIEKVVAFLKQEKKSLRKKLLPGKRVLTWNEIRKLEETYRFVEKEVEGRKRDSGTPEITHFLGVLVIAIFLLGERNIHVLMACVTHDLIEDFPTRWSNHRLRSFTSPETAAFVLVVTRDRHEHMYENQEDQNAAYYEHIGDLEETAKIKVSDGFHNQLTLRGYKKAFPTPERLLHLKRKMAEAENKLLALARRYGYLEKEIEEIIAENWAWIREMKREAHLEPAGIDRDF